LKLVRAVLVTGLPPAFNREGLPFLNCALF
jgi:hypothetical protein